MRLLEIWMTTCTNREELDLILLFSDTITYELEQATTNYFFSFKLHDYLQ